MTKGKCGEPATRGRNPVETHPVSFSVLATLDQHSFGPETVQNLVFVPREAEFMHTFVIVCRRTVHVAKWVDINPFYQLRIRNQEAWSADLTTRD